MFVYKDMILQNRAPVNRNKEDFIYKDVEKIECFLAPSKVLWKRKRSAQNMWLIGIELARTRDRQVKKSVVRKN